MSAKYLVDSNYWITCENELYPRRHFPSFWVEIEKYLAGGIILHRWSVDEELKRKNDVTSHWMDGLIKKVRLLSLNDPKRRLNRISKFATGRGTAIALTQNHIRKKQFACFAR